MNKIAYTFIIALLGLACDGEVRVNEKKLDTAGAKLHRAVKEGVDTIEAKIDRLEDKLDKDDTLKK